ncbi:S-adenosyl-L-methionine-dependent methyltransferase [Lactifluus subvellereus]|nr:S-adenosyl-L-methionine-dependent methyltransferase [Lactifluus subvellereus]
MSPSSNPQATPSQPATTTDQPPAARVSQDTLGELKALANIIQSSIEQIEGFVTANSYTFPSSDSTFSLETEAPRMHPIIQSAGSFITSAAAQLITLVRPAPLTLLDVMMQFHVSTALRTAMTIHVAEILRDAGPQGKHVRDIAKPTNVHPGKLARILRSLATNYIFTEVTPDIFANNRLSSVLDTGKSVEELLARPESKHIGTLGLTSIIEHVLDEAFKSSAYLPETLLDPDFGHTSEANKTALNKAFNFEGDMWSWYETPENRLRLARFGAAMTGLKNMSSADAILEGYGWGNLPEGSLVVDVGGGVGSQSLTLATHHSHLRFIVQDREAVVGDAIQYWKTNMPDAVESGRVRFQAQDFFEPQRAQKEEVSVYLLRMIVHDWADKYCFTILKHLRAAAGPKTQIVIVEQPMMCACDEPATHEIPGAELPVPPEPLLPNLGRGGSIVYNSDIMMMGLFNGQERTVTNLRDLLAQTSWKLIAVYYDTPAAIRYQKSVAIPN